MATRESHGMGVICAISILLLVYITDNCDHVSWSTRCHCMLLCVVYSPYMAISEVINPMATYVKLKFSVNIL